MAQHNYTHPFEGPEKLLEIWFAPSPADVPDAATSPHATAGLRKVDRAVWEEMLDIVQCKVLSVVQGDEMDAYLLSESSFFVAPHRLILKTCGTTLNLLGLPRILEIAATQANLSSVYRCFYSRKSFMFPERQLGPHRGWNEEVGFLDNIFPNGAAYTVGKVNGDHWLLYLTGPDDRYNSSSSVPPSPVSPIKEDEEDIYPDYTIEILMSKLGPAARKPFFTPPFDDDSPVTPSSHAQSLSTALGISQIFPPHLTTLDAFAFTPCGYSSNALVNWRGDSSSSSDSDDEDTAKRKPPGEGYFTIHVTPEEGWSYASFECNVPLSAASSQSKGAIPDLKTLVERVVNIFQPGRLSLTLFISNKDNEADKGESAVEAAQRAFKTALTTHSLTSPSNAGSARQQSKAEDDVRLYRRTDKINYEFGDYDLAFASFELMTE